VTDEATGTTEQTGGAAVVASLYDAVNAASLAEQSAEGEESTTQEAQPEAAKADAGGEADLSALRSALESGDIEALASQLGVKLPKTVNHDWVRLRQSEKRHKSQLREAETKLSAQRAEVEQAKSNASVFIAAKQRYEDGDVAGALSDLFGGDDIDTALTKALQQKHGRDPAVVKMERKLKELEDQKKEAERLREEQEQARIGAQQEQNAITGIAEALKAEEDETFQAAGEDPRLVRMIFVTMRNAWNEGEDLTVSEATNRVLTGLRHEYDLMTKQRWLAPGGAKSTVNAAQSGLTAPEKPAAKSAAASHVRASKTAVTPSVPDDRAAFGSFLRSAVNRAANGG